MRGRQNVHPLMSGRKITTATTDLIIHEPILLD